jgi:2-oxo-4-hydroxy-4-carboxy--5-ureidoimidazoline (OHCU) decarboxylase
VERKEQADMKAQDVTQLTNKIRLEYGFTEEAAQDRAMQVLENCHPTLNQNVEEWAKGQNLTDIYISKYSLPMILAIWNSRDFLKALEVMTELAKGNTEIAELKIWNMRR